MAGIRHGAVSQCDEQPVTQAASGGGKEVGMTP